MVSILHSLKRRRNSLRRLYYTWRAARTAGATGHGMKVNHASFFTASTIIGDFANFNGMLVSGRGKVSIGRYFHSGTECRIIPDIHNYDHGSAIPYGPGSEDISKDVVIEDFVWLGDRVIVLGGVILGEGCIVQAGSVVTKSLPPLSIAGGHPAKVFRMRDAEHFNRLKALGRFH